MPHPALPERAPNESAQTFFTRVSKLYMRHLDGCRDCNYDYECMACNAAGATGHSCNCHAENTDGGYGNKLGRVYRAAYEEAHR